MLEVTWRPYQNECKKSVKQNYDEGVNKQLIVQATGTGKRLAAVGLMPHFKRSLFIAHREELISQAYDEVSKYFPMNVGIVKGKTFEIDKKIVVASVQTLVNRLDRIDPYMFDLIVIDEAHHYISPSYLKVARHWHPRLLTGWTATPKRLDGLSLSNLFEKIVFQYGIADGIKDGFLAPIEAFQIKTMTDISKVKRTAGDFNQKQLSEVVDSVLRNNLIVQKYKQYADQRQFIAYCVDIAHAYHLRDEFRTNGISCDAVSSDLTRGDNRSDSVKKFKNKEILGLINCEILCLDLKTEILTSTGWKKHDTIRESDQVANWKTDGTIYFKAPFEIVKRPLYSSERMVSVNSKGSNIRVTNTHRMLYMTNRGWEKQPAESFVNKRWKYPVSGIASSHKIVMFQEKHDDRRAIITNSYALRKNNGYNYKGSVVEAKSRLAVKRTLKYKHPSELTLDECRFIGFWLGDGSKNNLIRNGVEYTLAQSKAYPEIIKWIDSLLTSIGLHFIKRDKGSFYIWSLNRGTSGINPKKGVYSYEPYLDKKGSDLFWGFDNLQWRAFIEGYWYADGLHGKAEKVPASKRIYSINYEFLSTMQAISVCRGLNATISLGTNHLQNVKYKKIWIINIEEREIRNIQSADSNNRLQYEDYKEEMVWCVKTETKNIITRRDGQVCIMGNTEGFDYSDVGAVLMGRPTQSETLYTQCIGRGTRLKSAAFVEKFKDDKAIILDFVDNTGKLNLINAYELEKDIPVKDRIFIPEEHREKLLDEEKRRRERMISLEAGRDRKIDLLRLPEIKVWDSAKMEDPATDKQIDWLRTAGIYAEDTEYTKKQASELISALPCQEWQIRYLAVAGYDVSKGASIGQYQRVKAYMDNKNKFAITDSQKNKILNQKK